MSCIDWIVILTICFICYDGYYNRFGRLHHYWGLRRHAKLACMCAGALIFYLSMRTSPIHSQQMMIHLYNAMGGKRSIPWSPEAMRAVAPVTDFTSMATSPPAPVPVPYTAPTGGTKATKRCVSETKKKFVAARQNWTCDVCHKMLTHTYEIDHRTRLEFGGSNDADNLVALCRECHGQKTAMENM
jgi:hypothetical protein